MVEVLVASSIIIISVLAIMTVAQKSISISHQSVRASQAAFLLEEGAENTRISRDNAWSNVVSVAPAIIGVFTRVVTVTNVDRDNTTSDIVFSRGTNDTSTNDTSINDTGTQLVTVTVSWSQNGATIIKILQFYISNIFSYQSSSFEDIERIE